MNKDPLPHPHPTRKLWLLAHTSSSGIVEKHLHNTFDSQEAIVAFRALRRAGKDVVELAGWAADGDYIAFRREALLALRDVPYQKKAKLLQRFASTYDGNDRWYLEALGTACENHEAEFYETYASTREKDPLKWSPAHAGIAWRMHPVAAVPDFLKRAMSSDLSAAERKQAIIALAFIKDRSAAEAMSKIANEGPEDHQDYANWWGHQRRSNDWKNFDIATLFPRPKPIVQKKTGGGKPRKNNVKVGGDKLFASKVAKGKAVVDIEADITGMARLWLVTNDAGDSINSDWGNWIEPKLVDASGKVTKLTDIPWSAAGSEWGSVNLNKNASGGKMRSGGKAVAFGIGAHANATIRYDIAGRGFTKLIAKGSIDDEKSKSGRGSVRFEIYGTKKSASGGKLDAKKIAKMKGDAKRGKKLYLGAGTCFACHKHGDLGADIGPDMSGIGQKFGREVILENIIDPSASVAFGYETVVIETKSGASYSGFLVADADPVILKDIAGNQQRIAKADIKSRTQQKISIMPPANALGLNAQQLADLVEFLVAK